jgi:hypothetical protein
MKQRTRTTHTHVASSASHTLRRQLPIAGALCLAGLGLAPSLVRAQATAPATQPVPVTQTQDAPPSPAPTVTEAPIAIVAAPVVVVPPPPPAAPVFVAPPAPPPPAPALPAGPPPGFNPVYTGSFFTRYEVRQGFEQLGAAPAARPRFQNGDAVYYRARFGFNTGMMGVGDDLKVGFQFTPQASGMMGALSNTLTDANLNLHEGYMRTQGSFVRVDAGRFELNYGDALVLGNLDWNETGRSFDGVRARVSKGATSPWVDLFATAISEGKAQVPIYKVNDGDMYLLGAYAGLGSAIKAGLDLDVYLLEQVWAHTDQKLVVAGTTPPATYGREGAAQTTLGARTKQKVGIIDYRAEVGVQAGTRAGAIPTASASAAPAKEQANQKVLAYQGDVEVGVQAVPEKLRISLEGLYASGDDPTTTDKNEGWDELYPTAHKFLGLSDAFVRGGQKRTDVASGVLHVVATPMKNLAINLDGHIFARPEKLGTAPTAKKGMAGSEVDLGAAYTLTKGLKVRALYALFMPSEDFYPVGNLGKGVSPDPVHFGEVELRYDLAP